MVLATALASALKFDGIFTLQTRTDGALRVLQVDVQTPGALRAFAQFDEEKVAHLVAEAGRENLAVPELLGTGYLSWTVDQGVDTERYQGIVALEGETLAECAENYFRQSEQLQAEIVLGVGRTMAAAGGWHWRAGGIMIQRLASRGGKRGKRVTVTEDGWDHARALVGTASSAELIDPDLSPRALLRRLFHESGVWVYEPQPLQARCRCSRERVQSVLQSFSAKDLADMVDDGSIQVTCDFCNSSYAFTEGEARHGVT
jgi:molecular chaperone Hsp33